MTTLKDELDHLLGRACVEGGFCSLSLEDHKRISNLRNVTAREFAIEVMVAEGFREPVYATDLRRYLEQMFIGHFGAIGVSAASIQDGTFWIRGRPPARIVGRKNRR